MTPDGEVIVNWARTVLQSVDTMRTAMRALSDRRRRNVVIAASLTIAEYLVPQWLGGLHLRSPDVQPVLQVMNSEAVAGAIRSGDADLGFIETTAIPGGLACRQVGVDPLVVVVAPNHAWAKRTAAVTAAGLQSARWVMRESGSGTRSTFEDALGARPEVAMEAASTMSLLGAAAAGIGPAVVSGRAVSTEVSAGHLVIVPTELDLTRPLTAIWRGDELLADAAADLIRIALATGRVGAAEKV